MNAYNTKYPQLSGSSYNEVLSVLIEYNIIAHSKPSDSHTVKSKFFSGESISRRVLNTFDGKESEGSHQEASALL